MVSPSKKKTQDNALVMGQESYLVVTEMWIAPSKSCRYSLATGNVTSKYIQF